MATEHEVKVKITGDIKDFKKSMKEAVETQQNVQKLSKNFRKNNIKGHKSLDKISKQIGKGQAAAAKASIKAEKKYQAVIDKTIQTMRRKMRESNNDHKSIEKEIKLLGRLEKKITSIRKQRHALGHKTMRERMGELGNRQVNVGRMGRWALGMAGAGLGLLVGSALGQIGASYSTFTQYGAAQAGLVGLGGRRLNAFRGQRFGYDAIQTAQAARAAGRATGDISSVDTAQALSRAIGADVGESTGWMAALRAAGSKFSPKDRSGAEELKKIIALGMESGIERARLPENIAGVMNLVQRQRGVSAGDFSAMGFSKFLAAIGRTGLSGFQGSAGGNVAAKIDAAIRGGGGGGDAGQALLLQAFGFGKPGATRSYMDALRSQELGLSDPANFTKVMGELTAQFGQGDERTLAMKNLFGTSISQSEELAKLHDSGKMGNEELAKLKDIAMKSESIEKQALKAMRSGFGDTSKYLAGLQNQLIDKGSKIAKSIRQLQTMFNEFVEVLWPGVVTSLKLAVDILKQIREVLVFAFGGDGHKQALKIEQDTAALMGKGAVKAGNKVARYQGIAYLARLRGLEENAFTQAREQARRHGDAAPLYDQAASLATQRGALVESAINRVGMLSDLDPNLRTRVLDAIQHAGTARGNQALGQGSEVRRIVDAVLLAARSNAEAVSTMNELLREQRNRSRESTGVTPATHGAAPPRNPGR